MPLCRTEELLPQWNCRMCYGSFLHNGIRMSYFNGDFEAQFKKVTAVRSKPNDMRILGKQRLIYFK